MLSCTHSTYMHTFTHTHVCSANEESGEHATWLRTALSWASYAHHGQSIMVGNLGRKAVMGPVCSARLTCGELCHWDWQREVAWRSALMRLEAARSICNSVSAVR